MLQQTRFWWRTHHGRNSSPLLYQRQHQLWFLDQLVPQHNSAHPAAVRLTSSLNLATLERAFAEMIICDHEL